MKRDIDLNNLSLGDVLRLIAPLLVALGVPIAVLVLAPAYLPHAFLGLIVLAVVWLMRMPKEERLQINEAQRRANERLGRIPVVGGLLRLLDSLFAVFSLVVFAWFVYLIVKSLL